MTPKERELLTGMGNCYEACHADFEATVGMVASNRDRTPEDVKSTLTRLAKEYGATPEFQELRSRLPHDFPF